MQCTMDPEETRIQDGYQPLLLRCMAVVAWMSEFVPEDRLGEGISSNLGLDMA